MKKVLVIDLECTCWEGEVPAGMRKEIIEIGVTLYDVTNNKALKSASILVKPSVSEISEFCTKLTTITPCMVEKLGVSIYEAIEMLRNSFPTKEVPFISYGNFDKNFLQQECDHYGIVYPMSDEHINVKAMVIKRLKYPAGLRGAMKKLSLEFEGTAHRGVDDSINIGRLYTRLLNTNQTK